MDLVINYPGKGCRGSDRVVFDSLPRQSAPIAVSSNPVHGEVYSDRTLL